MSEEILSTSEIADTQEVSLVKSPEEVARWSMGQRVAAELFAMRARPIMSEPVPTASEKAREEADAASAFARKNLRTLGRMTGPSPR